MRSKLFLKWLLAAALVGVVAAGCANGTPPVITDAPDIPSEPPAQSESGEPVFFSVSNFAGSLIPGAVDGANAEARFIKPYGLCATPDGGLLVMDSYANQLRLVRDGNSVTLAGSAETLGQGGYPLGGYLNGAAAQAFLNRPRFAAVSDEGTIVFSDTGNHRIRVLYDGQVRLLAGDGTAGFADGDYRSAQFNTPSGVAIGAEGAVYVADTLNHCIRVISPTGEVSTLAGVAGQAGLRDGAQNEALFCEPNDLQIGPDGALYVVDKGNQRVRRIANEQVQTVAGSGQATDPTTGYIVGGYHDGRAEQAQFQYPTGLFVTGDGMIYLADTGNNCIRSISPAGEVATIAGTPMPGNVCGTMEQARFNQPIDVLADKENLYISDSYNHVIRLAVLRPDHEGGAE